MSLLRRTLKWGLIGLLAFLFALWFGFTTYFFNPLEDDYEYDVSLLIPRNVDFYLSKAGLAQDLDADLNLALAGELAASERLQKLRALPEVKSALEQLDVESLREEVRRTLAQLPVRIDPLTVFGGRDVAVAGYFQGQRRERTEWAIYGRSNWLGKLAVALLGHPRLADLESQGVLVDEVAEEKEGTIAYRLTGQMLERPLFVHRVRDVVVIGTDVELFRQIPVLYRQRGQDSFGLSAKYEDRINVAGREGDELEVFLDYRALSEWKGYTGRWPDAKSDAFGTAFLGRLFQSGAVKDLIGSLRFGTVLALDLHANLSSELLNQAQKRIYRQRGFGKEELLRDVASLVPADVGLFAAGAGDAGELLREALKAAEHGLVSNLEDLVRNVWSYSDAQPLIDDLDVAFQDRFAFLMRNNDYPYDPANDPPRDDAVVPAWALILWVENEKRVEQLRDTIHSNQGSLGIHGREPGSPGIFHHELAQAGGVLVYEYWSPFVQGTGHVATVSDSTSGGTIFVISNHFDLCGQVCQTYRQSAGGHRQLAQHPTFRTQVNGGLPSTSLVLWLNPKEMDATLRGMARRWARDAVEIDWAVERPRIEKRVLQEKMPGAVYGRLTPEEEDQLAVLAQPEIDAFDAQVRAQQGRRLELELRERIDAFQAVDALLCEIAFGKATIDLALRVKLPLEG